MAAAGAGAAAASVDHPPPTGLLDLGADELQLVAAWCGRSAPTLAQACRATKDVWQRAKLIPELLACALLTAVPQADAAAAEGWGCGMRTPSTPSSRVSALQQLFERGELWRAVADADAMRVLLGALGQYAALHPAAADQCRSALERAVTFGHAAAMTLLLAHGAASPSTWVLLSMAACGGHTGVVEALLMAHNQPHKEQMEIVMQFAVDKMQPAVVRLLAERWEGPPLDLWRCVSSALSDNDVVMLDALTCNVEHSLHIAPYDRERSLLRALDADWRCGAGEPTDRCALELLLQRIGATPQEMGPALVEAVTHEDMESATLLLRAGADVHHGGERALAAAVKGGCDAMVELLLVHGGNAQGAVEAAEQRSVSEGMMLRARLKKLC